jgi:hypothetical protein
LKADKILARKIDEVTNEITVLVVDEANKVNELIQEK